MNLRLTILAFTRCGFNLAFLNVENFPKIKKLIFIEMYTFKIKNTTGVPMLIHFNFYIFQFSSRTPEIVIDIVVASFVIVV